MLPSSDPVQALTGHRFEQRPPLGDDRRDRDDLVAGSEDLPQELPPAVERKAEERPPIEVEQVEGEERQRPPRCSRQPTRELVAIQPAVGVNDDDHAIEHGRPRLDAHRQAGQVERRRTLGPVLRDEHHVAAARRVGRSDQRQRPGATPHRLEEVLHGIEGIRQGPREHRSQPRGELRQPRLQPHRELIGHLTEVVARGRTTAEAMPLRAIGRRIHAVYPASPMAVRQSDTISRERASELVRAWAGGRPGPLGSVLGRQTAVDQVGVELRVESLKRRSIKKASKLWALDLAIRMMDLTTLEGRDTPGKIRALCAKAVHPQPGDPSIPSVAAVCLYPTLIPEAKDALRGSSVKVASVATAFPSGQTFRDVKIAEVKEAVAAGADEIDMVIDRGAFLSGDYATVFDEVVEIKDACADAHLKVILETGELGTFDQVRRASILPIAAGADLIQ